MQRFALSREQMYVPVSLTGLIWTLLLQVHMLSEDGDYSTKVFGNPLDNAEADFMVHVPKGFYSSFESLSNDQATFHSYIDIPGMRCCSPVTRSVTKVMVSK